MNKMKKIRFGFIIISFVLLIIFVNQVVVYYHSLSENKKLKELRQSYDLLKDDIKDYEELKNNYLVVLEEENGLEDSYLELQSKVEKLNKEIAVLQDDIYKIEKKIDDISQ